MKRRLTAKQSQAYVSAILAVCGISMFVTCCFFLMLHAINILTIGHVQSVLAYSLLVIAFAIYLERTKNPPAWAVRRRRL